MESQLFNQEIANADDDSIAVANYVMPWQRFLFVALKGDSDDEFDDFVRRAILASLMSREAKDEDRNAFMTLTIRLHQLCHASISGELPGPIFDCMMNNLTSMFTEKANTMNKSSLTLRTILAFMQEQCNYDWKDSGHFAMMNQYPKTQTEELSAFGPHKNIFTTILLKGREERETEIAKRQTYKTGIKLEVNKRITIKRQMQADREAQTQRRITNQQGEEELRTTKRLNEEQNRLTEQEKQQTLREQQQALREQRELVKTQSEADLALEGAKQQTTAIQEDEKRRTTAIQEDEKRRTEQEKQKTLYLELELLEKQQNSTVPAQPPVASPQTRPVTPSHKRCATPRTPASSYKRHHAAATPVSSTRVNGYSTLKGFTYDGDVFPDVDLIVSKLSNTCVAQQTYKVEKHARRSIRLENGQNITALYRILVCGCGGAKLRVVQDPTNATHYWIQVSNKESFHFYTDDEGRHCQGQRVDG